MQAIPNIQLNTAMPFEHMSIQQALALFYKIMVLHRLKLNRNRVQSMSIMGAYWFLCQISLCGINI